MRSRSVLSRIASDVKNMYNFVERLGTSCRIRLVSNRLQPDFGIFILDTPAMFQQISSKYSTI